MVFLAAACVLALVWLFLIAPAGKKADVREMAKCDFAHRGLFGGDVPENSLSAFARAVEKGYGIELDVQLTRDGQLCVFHDETLLRMCGEDVKVADLTAQQLKERTLGQGEAIPMLSEVLEVVHGCVPLLIEMKPHGDMRALCSALHTQMQGYDGSYCVESFHPIAVRQYKKLAPQVARGQLSFGKRTERGKNGARDFLFQHMLLHAISRPDFVARDTKGSGKIALWIVQKVFRTPVFVWTVRDGKRPANSDAVIFEGRRPE